MRRMIRPRRGAAAGMLLAAILTMVLLATGCATDRSLDTTNLQITVATIEVVGPVWPCRNAEPRRAPEGTEWVGWILRVENLQDVSRSVNTAGFALIAENTLFYPILQDGCSSLQPLELKARETKEVLLIVPVLTGVRIRGWAAGDQVIMTRQ